MLKHNKKITKTLHSGTESVSILRQKIKDKTYSAGPCLSQPTEQVLTLAILPWKWEAKTWSLYMKSTQMIYQDTQLPHGNNSHKSPATGKSRC
jgi:hypothetical protein